MLSRILAKSRQKSKGICENIAHLSSCSSVMLVKAIETSAKFYAWQHSVVNSNGEPKLRLSDTLILITNIYHKVQKRQNHFIASNLGFEDIHSLHQLNCNNRAGIVSLSSKSSRV
jgi:hypothetical protein